MIHNFVSVTKPDNSYIFSKIPPALNVSADANILAKTFPGKVFSIGSDGGTWHVDMYPNGLDSPSIRKLAREVHGDADLHGIEGEWVTVSRIIGLDNKKRYSFSTQHTAAIPVLMSSKTLGDLYPFSTVGAPITGVTVSQIQIDSSAQIPANTWGIAVRSWNANTARYEVQVPVWLPKP